MKPSELIRQIDPKKIEKYFPTLEMKNKFEDIKKMFGNIMEQASGDKTNFAISVEFVSELEKAASEMRKISDILAENSELGSKARLNEAIFWQEGNYVERSLYLAGMAREKNIKEPYRTQLNNLPAHACLLRYRQVCQISEFIEDNIVAEVKGRIGLILKQMKSSFYNQFNYFATDAYLQNPGHYLSAYHKLLAYLLGGYRFELRGAEDQAELYYANAKRLINEQKEPKPGDHYMKLNYIKRAYEEFKTFERLANQHKHITDRLEYLQEKAKDLIETGRSRLPKDYFSFTPYVTFGLRAASVITLICLSSAVFGIETDSIKDAINYIWNTTGEKVLGVDGSFVSQLTDSGQMNNLIEIATKEGGGIASNPIAALEGGGIAVQLAQSTDLASKINALTSVLA